MAEAVKYIDIGKRYGNNIIFTGINLVLNEGDALAVLGPSGSGKTTLLKITGLITPPSEGKLIIYGNDTTGLSNKHLSKLRKIYIGYSFQEPTFMSGLNVLENILLPLYPYLDPHDLRNVKEKAKEMLDELGLKGLEKRMPSSLSTGQRKRVDLARALIKDPKILIVDEPTANLDEESANIIREIIKKLITSNKTVIYAIHMDKKLEEMANKKIKILQYK